MSPRAANGSANEKPGKPGMREPERRDIVEISAGQEACQAQQRTTDQEAGGSSPLVSTKLLLVEYLQRPTHSSSASGLSLLGSHVGSARRS